MKKNPVDKRPDGKITKESNPIAKKGPAKRGGSVDEIGEEDVEEFKKRKKIAKKVSENDEELAWRKINRISDSGTRDDDDDGADADFIEPDEDR